MIKPYEWMVRHTPQTEWIQGRGMFIWLAMYAGGVGSGLYLASLYFNSLLGMFIGWLIALLMGGFYMLHLRKLSRFWRIFLRPQTSWIARGFVFITLFIGFGAIGLAFSYWLPGTAGEAIFKVLAGVFAFGQLIYTGFVLSYVKAIKFWNSATVPILTVTSSLLGGLAILLAINLGSSYARIVALEQVILIFLIIYALITAALLWNATYSDSAARESVIKIVRGDSAPLFWIGEVLFGIIIPAAMLVASYFVGETSAPLLITVSTCIIIGGLSLRYSLLKGGLYSPLLPISA